MPTDPPDDDDLETDWNALGHPSRPDEPQPEPPFSWDALRHLIGQMDKMATDFEDTTRSPLGVIETIVVQCRGGWVGRFTVRNSRLVWSFDPPR